jgi:hypothetical protein
MYIALAALLPAVFGKGLPRIFAVVAAVFDFLLCGLDPI